MEFQEYYSRHLPHIQSPGATVFITFRLSGSLPKELIQQYKDESRRIQSEISLIPDSPSQKLAAQEAYKKLFGKWDQKLDLALCGPVWLSNPDIAEMVVLEINNNDGVIYTLEAYSIMPNHVHLVITPLPVKDQFQPISKIMQTIKGRTARQANVILNRQGDFWQHESYDHIARDVHELERIIHYVISNPTRAGQPARWVYQRKIE